MKILAIGDIHGRDVWERLIEENPVDKVVFIGDYVDSFVYSDKDILKNLEKIIAYKMAHPDTCKLLLGNHDIQYLWDEPLYRCSGYRPAMKADLHEVFNTCKGIFKVAYQYDAHLFTHAGISKRWADQYLAQILKDLPREDDLGECLNLAVDSKKFRDLLFEVGPSSGGMRHDHSGIVWARPADIFATGPFDDEIHQVVGHTGMRSVQTISKYVGKVYPDASVTFIDTYGVNTTPYILTL